MKLTRSLLIGSFVALATCATVGAQGVQIQIQRKVVQLPGKIQADLPLLPLDALDKLKLTIEQNDKYAKLEAEFKTTAKAAHDKYQDDSKTLRDREQFKDAQDRLKADTNKAREACLAKLEPILTNEQKAVVAQVKAQQPKIQPNPSAVLPRLQPLGGARINPLLPPAMQNRLQLTEEQKKQIADIQKEAEDKVMKVLTDEQKKSLQQLKKGPILRPQPIQPLPRIQIQPAVPRVQPANPNKD